MRYIFIITWVISLMQLVHAQTNVQEPFLKDDSETKLYISDQYKKIQKKWWRKADTVCINSVAFAKFILDENGAIVEVSFTQNTPLSVKQLLRDIVYSTSGKWNPKMINGIAVKSEPILLPLIFQLEASCDYKTHVSHDLFGQALRDILKYDDGKQLEQLNCIIMKPLIISSVR